MYDKGDTPTLAMLMALDTSRDEVLEAANMLGFFKDKREREIFGKIYDRIRAVEAKISNWEIEIYVDADECSEPCAPKKGHCAKTCRDPNVFINTEKSSDGHYLLYHVYHHVHGIDPDDPKERYGMDFTPWDEYLGAYISKHTLLTYAPAFIVATCIWDMTFYGFNEVKIAKEKERILDIAKEPISEGKLISLEDLAKELGIPEPEKKKSWMNKKLGCECESTKPCSSLTDALRVNKCRKVK